MAAADGSPSASEPLSRINLRLRTSPHRITHTFSDPIRPIISNRRQVARVTLEGRLIGAEKATSYKSVGKGLSPAEAAAWELFTPLHRVLLVAIVAIASSRDSGFRRISQLQRSVDIRDEVLRKMQEKLDDLCEQMRCIKDESLIASSRNVYNINGEIMAEASEAKLCHCGTRVLHMDSCSCIVPLCSSQSIKTKDVYFTELSKDRLFENTQDITSEQDERRMSDLSDFCWSVASSADIQPVHLSTLAEEQELYNLRNECEEKDAIIKDLRTSADDSNAASSKRIAELEEVIRRKNMITMKLKKDITVLEQQVKKLTRLQKQSSSSTSSTTPVQTYRSPIMAENILYDMSSTSPSSSDCGSPVRSHSSSSYISTDQILQRSADHMRQQQASSSNSKEEKSSASPLLKENRVSRKGKVNPAARQRRFEVNFATRERQAVSSAMDNSSNTKKARRRNFQEEKTSQKKWV